MMLGQLTNTLMSEYVVPMKEVHMTEAEYALLRVISFFMTGTVQPAVVTRNKKVFNFHERLQHQTREIFENNKVESAQCTHIMLQQDVKMQLVTFYMKILRDTFLKSCSLGDKC